MTKKTIPTVKDLKKGDFIAFAWKYYASSKEEEIIVDSISSISENGDFLVVFLHGYKSISEYIKPIDVIAIGDLENGKGEIHGWTGNYHFINEKKIKEIQDNIVI